MVMNGKKHSLIEQVLKSSESLRIVDPGKQGLHDYVKSKFKRDKQSSKLGQH